MYKIYVYTALLSLNLILTMLDFWTITPKNTGEFHQARKINFVFAFILYMYLKESEQNPIDKIPHHDLLKNNAHIVFITMHYLGLSSKAKMIQSQFFSHK